MTEDASREEGAEVPKESRESRELDAEALAHDLAVRLEKIVDDRSDALMPHIVEDEIASFLSEAAQTKGKDLSPQDAAALAGLDVTTDFIPSTLPEELQGPEDGIRKATYTMDGKKIMTTSAMNDYYGGTLDEMDVAALSSALTSFIKKLDAA